VRHLPGSDLTVDTTLCQACPVVLKSHKRTLTDTQSTSTWTPTNMSSLCRSGMRAGLSSPD